MDYLPKIILSGFISAFIYGFLLLSLKNPELGISFFVFMGGGISFLIFQISSFFIKKLLERQLKYSDFIYIRKIFSVLLPYLIFLFYVLIFLIFEIRTNANLDRTSDAIRLGILFICVLFISFRSEGIKKKLINLQYEKFDVD